MSASSNCIENYIAAMFAYEFMDGGVDLDSLERIHRGDVREWVGAVAGSGLFTNAQVARVDAGWRHDPKSLLDTLLSEADEMTVKRCETTWAALDRIESPAERRELVAVGGYSTAVAPASTTIA
ncbi:hypothetical protein LCL87_20920 [Rhodococcus hoagii]|nr:hypothetical protein [Prescottella equi]